MGVVKFPKQAETFNLDSLQVSPAQVPEPVQNKKAPRRRAEGAFVIAEIRQLRPAMQALACPAALVWMFLMYETRRRRTGTITVSNTALAEWGISRKVKYYALARLEADNLIAVSKAGKRSPLVRILPAQADRETMSP